MATSSPEQVQAIEAALKQAYVFSKADPAEIGLLAETAEWVSLPTQSLVVREGDITHSLYILVSGKLIVKEAVTENSELIIARITPGDVVGEIGFLTRPTASATVRTEGPVELIRLGYDSLRAVFSQNPGLELKFYSELLVILAERIRKSNQALRNALLSGAMGRL
jgi:CRP/FNR family cyclic AMP-dependent transcriptional regulator